MNNNLLPKRDVDINALPELECNSLALDMIRIITCMDVFLFKTNLLQCYFFHILIHLILIYLIFDLIYGISYVA